ncbi:MAG: ABC transporter permease [Bryobacteraceae bacterium]|nr:ABC transporter permease [Bryobacteraceae bacterium]
MPDQPAPNWNRFVRERLPALPVAPAREAEIIEELAGQLEEAYQEALARGLNDAAARDTAERQFSPDEALKLSREIAAASPARRPPAIPGFAGGGARPFSGIAADVRFALRQLLLNPYFASFAILLAALGVGANTAIFSVVNAVLFRPLPYENPAQLVAIETRAVADPSLEPWTSYLDYVDLRARTRSFERIAAISPVWNVVIRAEGETERLETLFATAGIFPLLGVRPRLGRVFTEQEDQQGRPAPVAVLSHSYWMRRFRRDPGVIGRTLAIEDRSITVVGVLPESFRYHGLTPGAAQGEIDLWVPLSANPLMSRGREVRFLKVAGRLNPGVSAAQAAAELDAFGRAMAAQYPDSNRGLATSVRPFVDLATGRVRTALLVLLGVVGLVLLIACASLANLLLARAAGRSREIAIRIAMGASRARLLRQLVTESMVVAALGGLAGAGLAHFMVRAILRFAPATLPRKEEIAVDPQSLGFLLCASIVTGLVAGLAPAFQAWRGELYDSLKDGARSTPAGAQRLRAALVVVEVAVSVILLSAAGLLVHSFARMLGSDPGFRAAGLVTLSTQNPASVSTPAQRAALYRALEERIAALPGVEGVAAVSRLPLMGVNLGSMIQIEGRTFERGQQPEVEYRRSTPGYFATMGIPILKGRAFDERDSDPRNQVVVINEALARKFFPAEDPVGRRIALGPVTNTPRWITIIGVAGSVRHSGLDLEAPPEVYQPYAYSPMTAPILVVRASEARLPEIRAAVRAVNPGIALYNAYSMPQLLDRAVTPRRFPMLLLAGFALLALVLAAAGLYGVIAQGVEQRSREIGVRMALGAARGDVLRMVLRGGLRLAAAGIAVGFAGSFAVTRLMSTMLYEVSPRDPLTFTLAPLVLLLVAIAASVIPAARASRIDPAVILRGA